MPVLSSLTLAKRAVLATMRELGPRVYTTQELVRLLDAHRVEWRVASRISGRAFTEFLQINGELRSVVLRSPTGRNDIRYSWGEPQPYALAKSLRPKAYLSHASAMFFHGLTDQIPKSFYLNEEQTPKPKPTVAPTQETIDYAFKSEQRASKTIFAWNEYRYVFLSGKQTGNYGVMDAVGPAKESLKATDLERTLVDITVRPAYAGGVHEVAKAYSGAVGRVSLQKLQATLRNLDYIYPYHQAVGFYLERAGVAQEALTPFRKMGLEVNFYLAHKMHNPILDPSWRVYFPEGL
ncbi:MAG TPA: type IV toxin-antitoxin system AbiEi family antitoxin [Planctomycetota bacterium]|nr:type IV toxin-antitoxin system AbiEi family antitoxin [Planctomycetota bacterium]